MKYHSSKSKASSMLVALSLLPWMILISRARAILLQSVLQVIVWMQMELEWLIVKVSRDDSRVRWMPKARLGLGNRDKPGA